MAEDQHFHLPLSTVVSPGASHDLTSPLLRPGWTMEVVLLGQRFPGMWGGLTLWGMEWVEAGWPEMVSSHHSPTWKEGVTVRYALDPGRLTVPHHRGSETG